MNHYPRHIGDIAKDTAHLSQGQFGAYDLLLDWYYAHEKPIPLDKSFLYAITRAHTKPEKTNTDAVLAWFFKESPEGWKQKRCDEELAKYAEKSLKASESASARWGKSHKKKDADAMRTHCEGNASHKPVTNNQKETTPHFDDDLDLTKPSTAAAVCVALRSFGIPGINQQNPNFIQLMTDGAEIQEFVEAAKISASKSKGFAYVLAVVKGRREEISTMVAQAGSKETAPKGHWADSLEGTHARAKQEGVEIISNLRQLRINLNDAIQQRQHAANN